MARLFNLDPAETKDYKFDFRALTNQNDTTASGDLLVSGETIASIDATTATLVSGAATPAVVVGTGGSAPATADTASSVVVWLSGGADGAKWKIETTITTTAGRTYDRHIILSVTDL